MYKIAKIIGKILGYIICAATIEVIDLTDSILLNCFIISPTLLWIINKVSYYTCKIIIYRKLDINEPIIGCMGYWISYILYVVLIFGVLCILKYYNIIPIYTNLDKKIFNSIVDFFYSIFMLKMQEIINVLQV